MHIYKYIYIYTAAANRQRCCRAPSLERGSSSRLLFKSFSFGLSRDYVGDIRRLT